MTDHLARTISTVGIWMSYSIVLGFGVCRMNFNGDGALPTFLAAILIVSVAAVVSTSMVWRGTSRLS